MSARFLVAPDAFKGTFDATAVAAAIAAGVEAAGGSADRCPVGDGGEGTAAVLREAVGGRWVGATAHDPLRRPVRTRFALLGEGRTAAVDVAAASGLPLLAEAERDPERADTYGTGELVGAALEAGARRVLIAAGGSATTDGGRGAIEALRARGGLGGATLEVLCDVLTPFEEAANTFGPQKGADAAVVERLAARLDRFASELPSDPRGIPMGGCGGGLSGGLMAAFGARLRPGADFVFDAVGLDRRLDAADAAIGGEGRLDRQSLQGKAVGTLATRCDRARKPLHLLVGEAALPAAELPAAVASVAEARTLEALEAVAERLGRP